MSFPDVIFLNGASSAGKTSIARALQARLPEPYLLFGVDQVFPWLPPHWRETPEGFQLVALSDGAVPMRVGDGGLSVARGWHRMVRAGVDAGLRFIIDEVLIDDRFLPDWVETLAGRDVFFIGIRCDIAELQRREGARGDRRIGQSVSQYEAVHRHATYDLEIDTTAASIAACADRILGALKNRSRPSAFERLRAR